MVRALLCGAALLPLCALSKEWPLVCYSGIGGMPKDQLLGPMLTVGGFFSRTEPHCISYKYKGRWFYTGGYNHKQCESMGSEFTEVGCCVTNLCNAPPVDERPQGLTCYNGPDLGTDEMHVGYSPVVKNSSGPLQCVSYVFEGRHFHAGPWLKKFVENCTETGKGHKHCHGISNFTSCDTNLCNRANDDTPDFEAPDVISAVSADAVSADAVSADAPALLRGTVKPRRCIVELVICSTALMALALVTGLVLGLVRVARGGHRQQDKADAALIDTALAESE